MTRRTRRRSARCGARAPAAVPTSPIAAWALTISPPPPTPRMAPNAIRKIINALTTRSPRRCRPAPPEAPGGGTRSVVPELVRAAVVVPAHHGRAVGRARLVDVHHEAGGRVLEVRLVRERAPRPLRVRLPLLPGGAVAVVLVDRVPGHAVGREALAAVEVADLARARRVVVRQVPALVFAGDQAGPARAVVLDRDRARRG